MQLLLLKLSRMANRVDTEQSDLGLHCLYTPFLDTLVYEILDIYRRMCFLITALPDSFF